MFTFLAITIMSFNVRTAQKNDGANSWEYRKDACAMAIKDIRPDVVGFQENTLPQDTFFIAQLAMYSHVAVPRVVNDPFSETNAIYFLSDKYALVQTNSFWLSETPNVCSRGWDAKYPRIASYVVLRDKETDEQYLVFNTHTDHKGVVARQKSMQQIADTIASLTQRYPKIPAFVMGDLNVEPTDSALLPTRQAMLSAGEVFQNKEITCHGWGQYGKIIDYIFYQNIGATAYRVVNQNYGVPFLSDHYPIIATFKK